MSLSLISSSSSSLVYKRGGDLEAGNFISTFQYKLSPTTIHHRHHHHYHHHHHPPPSTIITTIHHPLHQPPSTTIIITTTKRNAIWQCSDDLQQQQIFWSLTKEVTLRQIYWTINLTPIRPDHCFPILNYTQDCQNWEFFRVISPSAVLHCFRHQGVSYDWNWNTF